MTDVAAAAVLLEHGQAPTVQPRGLADPRDGQCRVRVTAAPIVPLDLLCASGTSYFGPPALPYVPGVQGVGVVQSGDRLAPGTRIWFDTDAGMTAGDGSLAEAAVVDEARAVELTQAVGDEVVAALGLSAIAAWMALTWRGRLTAGETVLVLGASGVVGSVAVQAALALGAGRVVAATRQRLARERALQQGAAAVVDLTGVDADEAERRIRTAVDSPVDLVVDPVCGAAATAALRVLGERGRLVNLGSSAAPTATYASATLRSGTQSVLGYTNNALTYEQRGDALTAVLSLAAAGRCSVEHDEFALAHVAAAWERVGAPGAGRAVVVP